MEEIAGEMDTTRIERVNKPFMHIIGQILKLNL